MDHVHSIEVMADIGAGTGQLTRLFSRHYSHCYAVEPDTAMRTVGKASLADLPIVDVRSGSAESTGLEDDCVDLIVAGNAYHRFQPQCINEFRRILRPDGWCAVFSYVFTDRAFTDMLFSKLSSIEGLVSRTKKNWHNLSTDVLFTDSKVYTWTYEQSHQQTWEAFFGAACSGVEAPEPDDPEFVAFENINRQVFDALSQHGKIRLSYKTSVCLGQIHGNS